MLENLTQKLNTVFDKIRGRGALSEKDVDAALSEVRKALLEADVALEVVKVFLENTRKRAVGSEVLRSVTPGQMVIKVVHDELVLLLGNDEDASTNAASCEFKPARQSLGCICNSANGTDPTCMFDDWTTTRNTARV